MRILFSYARLCFTSCLLMGGLAIQFPPPAEATAREARWRERHLKTVPAEQQEQWIADRDRDDAHASANLRLFGVFLGGLGIAGTLAETAYLIGQYSRVQQNFN